MGNRDVAATTQAMSTGDDSLAAWHGGKLQTGEVPASGSSQGDIPISNILPPANVKDEESPPSAGEPCAPVDDRTVASSTLVTSPGDDSLVNWHANPLE